MFEVSCAACQSSFAFNTEDYIHLCPFCSAGFVIDPDEGAKDLIGDHYIVPSRVQTDIVQNIFEDWLKERTLKPEKIAKEFSLIGAYGVMLPYWVVSLEAHTFWSGHSKKAKRYAGQKQDPTSQFVREEGRFSKKYRWAVLARKSPKEHWGLERLHRTRESVLVDWDGFPLDETMGVQEENDKPIYDAKMQFRFEAASGLPVAGIQIKENQAIMRTKDQINEYHRRIAKSKIGTLFEYRTEIEIVGLHVVHLPFWFIRYTYQPKSAFKMFSSVRERHITLQGYTKSVLEAELPLVKRDKVMANLIVCSALALISLTLSIFLHGLFFFLFLIFLTVSIVSSWKILSKEKRDPDLTGTRENLEPVT